MPRAWLLLFAQYRRHFRPADADGRAILSDLALLSSPLSAPATLRGKLFEIFLVYKRERAREA